MSPVILPESFVISTEQTEWDDGTWTLTSDNLPGLFLAGRDIGELEADVPDAIRALFHLNYKILVDVEIAVRPAMKVIPLHPKRYVATLKAA